MLRRIWFFCVSILCFTSSGYSQSLDTAEIGIFITTLYDFNVGEGSYNTEFWIWAVHKNPEREFKENLEVKKAKSLIWSNYYSEVKEDKIWMNKKAYAKIIQDWDMKHYPFDKQQLAINIEETSEDASTVYYLADMKNTKIDSTLTLEEWDINGIRTEQLTGVYSTTFGDPTLEGKSEYSGVITHIDISRKSSWTLFIKITTGLYVSFLISLLVFGINPPDSESRISLAVGGLFASVGNKYITEGIVPTSTQNTLIDNLHNVTFLFILLIVLLVILSNNYYLKGKSLISKKIDKYGSICMILGYIGINVILILQALG
jgi:hypothetical protein